MLEWILIIVIYAGSNASAVAIDHVPFKTKEACEHAAVYMRDTLATDKYRAKTSCHPTQ